MNPAQRARRWIADTARRCFAREDVRFIAHAFVLLLLLAFFRPMFGALLPSGSYEAPVVLWSVLGQDLSLLTRSPQALTRTAPQILFLLLPTLLLVISGRRITWTSWESGRSLRVFIMALLVALLWTGSAFEYNMYLNRGHPVDRLLLVALTALSWRTPLAVPFAARWAVIMIKEAYVPIPIDDFDFRAVHEVLIVFSCFVWASARRTFNTRHFLLVALGAWASYYFAAGVAKANIGPAWSWLLDNHLSNLSQNAHMRGWLGFIPDDTFLRFTSFLRRFDVVLAAFTLVVELGALLLFFLHPRLTRLWLLLCFTLHLGIYLVSGICFWKWMVANLAFFFFLRRGGAPVIKRVCARKAVVLFGVLAVFFSPARLYYLPQTRVVWYDSKLLENYLIYAIGKSGQSYVVNPSWLRPMETHFVQGRLCDATDERMITGIYGSTSNYRVLTALEDLKKPEEALELLKSGADCTNPARRELIDGFFVRYFGNLNRHGRPHRWLSWFEGPTHIWVQPRGQLYDMQEPVVRIELWRELLLPHDGKIRHLETKKVHEVKIPL